VNAILLVFHICLNRKNGELSFISLPISKLSLVKRQTVRRKQPTETESVEDLPTEVLTAIFKYVHVFSMTVLEDTPERKASPGSVYRDPEKRPEAYVPHSLAQVTLNPEVIQTGVVAFSFPLHTVSSVSRLWRDVARNLPEYWSRLVIFIDENFTPLSEVQKQIELSGHVPLDIFVIHRDFDTDDDDDDDEAEREASRVEAVMKLLAPLIPRSRCFVFNVKYSSSLPYISQDFRGHAPDLRVLKLQCMIDDGRSRPPPAPEIAAEEEFTFPLLTTVALDGCTFMDACNVPSWKNQLNVLVIDTLSISNFTAPGVNRDEDEDSDDEDEPFDLYALVNNLSHIGFIRNLILNNVNTALRTGDFDEGCYEIQLNNLTVIGNQDIEYMQELHLITFGSTLCYYHLADTPLSWESIPLVHHLRLQRTPNMEDYDFRRAMTRFFGNRLDLLDCEGLSDEHLLNIAGHCEPLRRLYIKGCPNITVEGLRDMITERNRLVGEDDDDDDDDDEEDSDDDTDEESILECDDDAEELIDSGFSASEQPPRGFSFQPIHRLVVVGHPEKLTKSSRQWFRDRVRSFHWE
jgi:hypothetical protein